MSISKLINQITQFSNCEIELPKGAPSVGMNIPSDVEKFYRKAGGAKLFLDKDYSIDIVSPDNFVRANPIIVGDECKEDISYDWFIIARSDEQYITIDLNETRLGRCYDSFWDRHGVSGECQVIANSFEDLLDQLLNSRGGYWYWLNEDYISLGDAYE